MPDLLLEFLAEIFQLCSGIRFLASLRRHRVWAGITLRVVGQRRLPGAPPPGRPQLGRHRLDLDRPPLLQRRQEPDQIQSSEVEQSTSEA